MKKILLSVMLSLTFTLVLNTVKGQDWQLLDGKNSSIETKINLESAKSQQMVLEFDFNAYALEKVNTSKGLVNSINIPNCSRTKIKGAPDLPKISQAMALNKMAGLELNIVESEYIEIDNIDLAPSKGILTRDKNPKSIAFEYGDVYTQDAFYPSSIAEMSDSYYIRNTSGQNVVVYPVQYNPVTKKVRVYTKIIVEFVEKAGVKRAMNFNPNAKNDAVFESVLSNHFINYGTSAKYTPISETGKKMLIVCYSSFMDEMAEFVSWKESIGYTVNLVDYSTIGSESALETYVQNQYDQNGISYLLLVGDHAQVPSSSTSAGDSDNNYGYTSGSDHYLDIFVGRFSADNATDLQTQIDRTIHYERDVDASESWIKKGVGIASNEGGSGGDDGEDDETHMNNIENDLEGFGYTMDRVYQDGGSASQLSADLNEGRGIINYVGHGSDYTWASMVYSQSNVNALTNENKLPFVVSVACVVGNFTNKTCFAETWLQATNNSNPTGAIVFCGSTINQSWASPMCAQDEMNDLLVAGTYINYGGMFINGVFQMIDEYGSDGENMADTWTVFGDPSLQMRTPGQPDGPAGSVPTVPTANFSASVTEVLVGNSVNFTDQSTQSPTSWSWSFEGGTPSTSTSENPSITYNTVGTYNVILTATNAVGSDTEAKTEYIEVVDELPVEYCESKGTDFSYEWIAGVAIGDFSNTSTAASYTDFTSKTVEMEIGVDYNVNLTPGFASSTYDEYWKIWIDLNKDGDFEDAGELIFDAGALSKNAVSGTATIPVGTTAKTTRMRVSMKYNAEQTSCETFSYGEVEDYKVNIIESGDDTEAPTAPTGLSSSGITQTTFTLSWNASSDNVGVTGYDVYKDGSLLASTANTSYNLTNLTAGTTYSFYVKAKDAAGNLSAASSTLNVTTDDPDDVEAPTAPTNLVAYNVTENSATLSWTASTDNVGVTGYDVYKNGSYLANTSSTSYTATGLSASTTYTFYVKAKDAMGLESNASNTISVTTDDVIAEYCTSKGSDYSYEWISQVVIGSYTKSSGAAGYTDFTSENIPLEAGSSVNVSLTPGFASSTYNEYWKIWIDYNNDAIFADSELAFDAGAVSKNTVNGTMNILATASGTTRMRVSMKYNGAQTACESFSYGEVEDYTVTFGDAVLDTEAPSVPNGLSASNITNSSATISWNASSDNVEVTSYDVYRNGTLIANTPLTYYNASGLNAGTTYSFTVKAKDEAGNVSASSNALSVSTTSAGNSLTLTITFDNYPEETSWTLKNSGGSTVASGGTYTSQADGSTLVIPIDDLADDCYDFTISDTYGDGICCSYGNGSYKIEAGGSVLASGGSFTSSEVTNFCLPSSAYDYASMSRSDNENVSGESIVNIYPNPASTFINVDVINGHRVGRIRIYNTVGALVKTLEMNGNEKEIDISELPTGLYIISIEDEKEPLVKQFIKQ
jgi:chitodextrinase